MTHRPSLRFAAVVVLSLASAAHADQFIESADNGEVRCAISSRELTRISLVGDGFASVSKITTNDPASDFTVTNEPVRGDIYVSIAPTFAAPGINFFATSKKGSVYKFSCVLGEPAATQIFVSNAAVAATPPARGDDDEDAVERDRTRKAVRLIKAMATSSLLDGYRLRQAASATVRTADLKLQTVAEYRGGGFVGRVVRIDALGTKTVALEPAAFVGPRTVALSLGASTVVRGSATTLLVVEHAGDAQ